jgi:hypothetical protein
MYIPALRLPGARAYQGGGEACMTAPWESIMARLRILWLRDRLGRKRVRASGPDRPRIPCGECGHWGLVDAMMRSTEAPVR